MSKRSGTFGLVEIEKITGLNGARVGQWRARQIFRPENPTGSRYCLADVLQLSVLGELTGHGLGPAHAAVSLPGGLFTEFRAIERDGFEPGEPERFRKISLVVWTQRDPDGLAVYAEIFRNPEAGLERIRAVDKAGVPQFVTVVPIGQTIINTWERVNAMLEGVDVPDAPGVAARGWGAFHAMNAPGHG